MNINPLISLKYSLTDAVSHYYKINNILPKKIVIYRDGVGDGNLRYVVEQEVGNMKVVLPV